MNRSSLVLHEFTASRQRTAATSLRKTIALVCPYFGPPHSARMTAKNASNFYVRNGKGTHWEKRDSFRVSLLQRKRVGDNAATYTIVGNVSCGPWSV